MRMRGLSRQRRKVVVLAASAAAMSGVVPLLSQRHHTLAALWMGFVTGVVAVALMQMVRLKRQGG